MGCFGVPTSSSRYLGVRVFCLNVLQVVPKLVRRLLAKVAIDLSGREFSIASELMVVQGSPQWRRHEADGSVMVVCQKWAQLVERTSQGRAPVSVAALE